MSDFKLSITQPSERRPDKLENMPVPETKPTFEPFVARLALQREEFVEAVVAAIIESDEWPRIVFDDGETFREAHWREVEGLVWGVTLEREGHWDVTHQLEARGNMIVAVCTEDDLYPLGNEVCVIAFHHPVPDDVIREICARAQIMLDAPATDEG